MKFEEKLIVLTESIIDGLGPKAKGHAKLVGIDPKTTLQDRVEVMLEVATEVVETQNRAAVSTTISSDLQQLRKEVLNLSESLENISVSVPGMDKSQQQNSTIIKKLENVQSEVTAIKQKSYNTYETTIGKKDRYYFKAFLISVALVFCLLFVIAYNWASYFEYKISDEKWRYTCIVDQGGYAIDINKAWEIDSIRIPKVIWLEKQTKKFNLEEDRRTIDQELEKLGY
jgi:hypothetical protein